MLMIKWSKTRRKLWHDQDTHHWMDAFFPLWKVVVWICFFFTETFRSFVSSVF